MDWYLKVLKKYAVFKGRAQKAEYWYFMLFNLIFYVIFNLLDRMLGTINPLSGNGLLSGIYLLIVFMPTLAVSTRRLHDIGKSGWWQLVGLIPLFGAIALLAWYITDSEGDNRYGKNPKSGNNRIVGSNSI